MVGQIYALTVLKIEWYTSFTDQGANSYQKKFSIPIASSITLTF